MNANTNLDQGWEPEVADDAIKLSYLDELVAVCSRVAVSSIFWLSGRTKVDGYLSIKDSTYELFTSEYKLPYIPTDWAAHMATYAEHLFPVLLILGLFTKLSAFSLLMMTAVIQIFVYPSAWPTHLSWATMLLFLMFHGGGRFAIDRFIR